MSGPTRGRARRALTVVVTVAAVVVGVAGAGASPAAAAPVLTISPGGPYLDLHPVTVTASGLEPGSYVLGTQCWDGACPTFDDEFPLPVYAEVAQVAPDGTWTAVIAFVREANISSGGTVETVSCNDGPCTFELSSWGEVPVATVPITFAPSGTYQYPEAQVSLARTTGIIGGERILVTGSGFSWFRDLVPPSRSPTPTATRQMCRAVAAPGPGDCEPPKRTDEWFSDRLAYVGGYDGAVGGAMPVPRHVETPSGPLDCAVVGCTFALTQQGNPVSNRIPLTYAPEWAPFASAGAFIDQVVAKVGGRPITGAARSQLAAALTARTTTGVQAVVDAASTSALDADVGEVTRLYRAFFDRDVETGGLTYWVGRMRAGMTALQVSRAFGGTAEFRRRYDALADAGVVNLAYRTTLGREPSASDLTYWTGRLADGMRRTDLVYSFARSPELRNRTAANVRTTIVALQLGGFAPGRPELEAGAAAFVQSLLLARAGQG